MSADKHPAEVLAEEYENGSQKGAGWEVWQCQKTSDMLRRIPALEAERDQLRAEVERLRSERAAALGLVASIRFALGDNGARMQDELIEWCKTLPAELDKLRAEIKALQDPSTEHVKHTFNGACPDLLDRHRRDPDCPACALLGAARKVAP